MKGVSACQYVKVMLMIVKSIVQDKRKSKGKGDIKTYRKQRKKTGEKKKYVQRK